MQRVHRFRVWPDVSLSLLEQLRSLTLRTRPLSTLSILIFLLSVPTLSAASELEDCELLLRTGQYQACIQTSAVAIDKKAYGSEWPLVKAQAELALGQYAEAQQTVDAGLKRYSWSLPLRYLAWQIYHLNNEHEAADVLLASIHELASRSAWRYTDADSLVALGQASLLRGMDPGEVLETFYDRAIQEYPDQRDAWLASGNLALDKHDFALASETFAAGLKQTPNDPDLLFGLSQALQRSDPQRAATLATEVLKINPYHLPSRMAEIARLIDSEEYATAKIQLDQILAINPHLASAWASLAAIAHFENRPFDETAYYQEALSHHDQNPRVDYLIGKILSEHYRFAEGAAYQKQALEKDLKFLPARIQLAQDQLRLGQEVSGWEHALQAHAQDGYDTTTFNLLELKDQLARFKTLEDESFIIRMEAREADIYGQQVKTLLHQARKTLCQKYGLQLDQKITVEIFPDPDDFAVRTFGMPAVSGYLGVCFGKVITANSPASQADHPTSWESVLWHEFCHVVTLELTSNKMPRWISEGISVYEERQKNPYWGEVMIPQYRELILKGETTPISQLSSAFMNPKSSLHIQFAYFQSSMVVEYLVQNFGLETIRNILGDLQAGVPINVAIERHTKTLGELEEEYAIWLKAQADRFAPRADWSEQDLRPLLNDDTKRFDDWVREHPNHFRGLMAYASILAEENRVGELETTLKKLVEIYPEYTGADNASLQLAQLYQKQKRFDEEQQLLEQHARINPNALDVFQRLIERYQDQGNWSAVYQTVRKAHAVNPLNQETQQALATACIKLDRRQEAIQAYQAILALEPHNKAEAHYQLARLLQKENQQQAKRHTLIALEQAPRFRAAHLLLLELTTDTP
ncbi:Anaphase-promoting complex, cyclosome, subunit 3 [Gimesia panareensis]|uniref:Anaphase-promoting complex, cyclosome, subunit 3 n=1 Tax=Gimesia panareensis TaxID=2527978 RepID=A0A517Q698_9PLAN|nr:BTAD domain-containing putative transcriptional regulator [Gimesia panareensis]QDT27134.1 Anaphase-promoting complex, cyclosome, subunit 3 [Gimesia panareensis]